ncbi:hypothetical protein ABET11_27580 [Priestia megaterium]|uniref:hypothetical protein n=2 Tax=Priestia megaterium TaxID=1404 RepID=UPI000BF2D938|nr:hypothetical protein [Priestia megaterium]MED3872574.1 hypothetical protein [Priestia megaterium]PER75459.1 hypothetical protein CN492_12515 [Priestia megaterium]PEU55268.1 hypothetical protein CN395_24885 [Priestia megaterium]PEW13213.1 hypothetical protein CN435_23620 [Priestia megaterium]PEZ50718.1 hypothetical protein CN367_02320 [Priestia megaterium]
MITIQKYDGEYNKQLNSQQKNNKCKKGKICININIYNHAETGGQISGNGGQNANQGGQIAQTGGQNANQDGVVVRKCGKKNKDNKVKKINFEDDMK